MKNITNITFAIAVLGLTIGTSQAAGTASAQFLKMGAGARAAAMGDAYTSIANDVTAGYWNPAGLKQMESAQVAMMQNNTLLNTQYQYLGAALPFGNNAIAASFYRMDYGSIDAYSNTDVKGTSFDAGSMAASFSFAHEMTEGLNVGVTGKYISDSIDSVKANAFAGDFGVTFKESKFNRFNFGLSIRNIGTGLKYVKETESLPRIAQAGVSTKLFNDSLLGSVDLSKSSDNDLTIHIGGEYKVNPLLALRGGYKTTPSNQISVNGLTNVSAGVGLNLQQFTFDYAFVPYGDLGSSHRVSLLFHFASSKN